MRGTASGQRRPAWKGSVRSGDALYLRPGLNGAAIADQCERGPEYRVGVGVMGGAVEFEILVVDQV